MSKSKKPEPAPQSVTFLTPDDLAPILEQLATQNTQIAALEAGAVEVEARVTDHDALLQEHEARLVALEAAPGPEPPDPEPSNGPDKTIWEAHMIEWGIIHGDWLDTQPEPSNDAKLDHVYYDQGWAFHQIADYTGTEEPWRTYAKKALAWFYDYAITRNNGSVPGYYNFTHGLRKDFEVTGDERSKQGVITLSKNAMYATDSSDIAYTETIVNSREAAYAVLSYIDAEALGEPRRSKRQPLVEQMYGHVTQFQDTAGWGTREITPFMMAITSQSLIADWQETQDARCLAAVRQLLDFVWPIAWHEPTSALKYQINPAYVNGVSTTGAVDLNMIIAPWCAWLWVQTGEGLYRDRFDAMLYGSKDSYLQRAKQYNQNYWWSFEGMRWREESTT